MNVLVATGLFPPDIGGPATYAKLLSEELPRRGVPTAVLSFGVVRMYPKGIRHLLFLWKLLRQARPADVIFAQDTVSVGFPAAVAAWLLGKKFFVRVPGDYAWEQAVQRHGVSDSIDIFQHKRYGARTELLRRAQRWVVGQADCVITPSEYFKTLVAGWVRNPEKVTRIYNGIELPTQLESREVARKTVHVLSEEILVVSAGRLVPWKGFTGLIDAVVSLRTQGPWRLVIAGDGPERERLANHIVLRHAEDYVQLVGILSQPELNTYLRAADVFALNTEFESFSFQTVQAMGQGVPVVVTDVGNLREIVTDGVEGLVVPVRTPDALSKALLTIGSQKDIRSRMGRAGAERAQDFSIQKTVDQVVELLHQHLS